MCFANPLCFLHICNATYQAKMRKLLFSLIAVSALTITVARADDPPGFGGGSPDPIPVDGGASLLVAAGVSYGYKRLRSKKAAK